MKFQNCNLIFCNGHTNRQTDKPKAICPFNVIKVGGIKNLSQVVQSTIILTLLMLDIIMYILHFSCLLIAFANILDPDQDQQNVASGLNLNCLILDSVPERIFF